MFGFCRPHQRKTAYGLCLAFPCQSAKQPCHDSVARGFCRRNQKNSLRPALESPKKSVRPALGFPLPIKDQQNVVPFGYYRSDQKKSLRPAEAVTGVGVTVGFTTVSPVKGQPEGARGKQVLGIPIPAGPLVPQTIPARAVPLGLHCASLVHPGVAAEGYVSENTAS